MKTISKVLFATLVAGTSPAVVYVTNPFNVQTEDIRPRILGHDIYRIPSRSMQPTLIPGDYIIISNSAYLKNAPTKGDVIVFKKKSDKKPNEFISYIKRIIAIAGDTIKISKGTVFINHTPLKEDYIEPNNKKRRYSKFLPETKVPSGMLYVLGDNRDNSRDSRLMGFIPEKDVIGKATSILYGKNKRSGQQIK